MASEGYLSSPLSPVILSSSSWSMGRVFLYSAAGGGGGVHGEDGHHGHSHSHNHLCAPGPALGGGPLQLDPHQRDHQGDPGGRPQNQTLLSISFSLSPLSLLSLTPSKSCTPLIRISPIWCLTQFSHISEFDTSFSALTPRCPLNRR